MKALIAGSVVLAALSGAAWAQVATPTPIDCDAVRCQVQSMIDACAANARNHGKCVSCIAHATKDPSIPKQCRGKIVRCAARSTCGKPSAETCQTTSAGSCGTDGTCSQGTLADGLTTCTQDSDCVVTHCHVEQAFPKNVTPVPGQDKCTLQGGTPGTGTCCAACPTAP